MNKYIFLIFLINLIALCYLIYQTNKTNDKVLELSNNFINKDLHPLQSIISDTILADIKSEKIPLVSKYIFSEPIQNSTESILTLFTTDDSTHKFRPTETESANLLQLLNRSKLYYLNRHLIFYSDTSVSSY